MPIVAMLSLTLFLVNWVRFFCMGVLASILSTLRMVGDG